jgi:hypothetical protein
MSSSTWDSIVTTLKKYAGPVLGSIPNIIATACLGPLGGVGVQLATEAIKGIANLIFPDEKKEELGINSSAPIPQKRVEAIVQEIDKTIKRNPAIVQKMQKPLRNLERELQVKLKGLELKIEQQRTEQVRINGEVDIHASDNEVQIEGEREDTRRYKIKATQEVVEDKLHVDNVTDARHTFSHNSTVLKFGMTIVWAVLFLLSVSVIASFFVDDSKLHYSREITMLLFGSLIGSIINFFFGSSMGSTFNRFQRKD